MYEFSYIIICPLSYLLAGSSKFIINFVFHRLDPFKHLGLGGFPSTHTTIVSSVSWLMLITSGYRSEVFAISLACTFIVIIDAMDTRNKIGLTNQILNLYLLKKSKTKLKEKIGHNIFEVIGGLCMGLISALATIKLDLLIMNIYDN